MAREISVDEYTLLEHNSFLAKGKIKLITLALEILENKGLIVYAFQQGAVVGVGHSAASYEEVSASVPSGLTHGAHMFNAMLGLHHREPGAVGAVLTCDGVIAEVVADNTHLHPVVARVLMRAKGVNTSVLAPDAILIRH
jgi:N-acetylglucosamine-6-phosphate deacetylase